jgi:broad specificity phosphatase PhoE
MSGGRLLGVRHGEVTYSPLKEWGGGAVMGDRYDATPSFERPAREAGRTVKRVAP